MFSPKKFRLLLQISFLLFIIKVDSDFAQSTQNDSQTNFVLNDLASISTIPQDQEPSNLDIDQELQKSLIDILPLDSQRLIPEMCLIGDPNNACDPATGLGCVSEPFQVGKYETTIGQWLQFTSAVTQHGDPHGLIKKEIFTDQNVSFLPHVMQLMKNAFASGNDDFLSSPETRKYFIEGLALPMTYVTLDDAKRYCNWLHHGAPSGDAVTEETTETGAYEFRNGHHGEPLKGALFFILNLNQWYKAAYYKQGTQKDAPAFYWNFPFQKNELKNGNSDLQEANFAKLGWFSTSYINRQPPYLTPVNHFDNNSSPYGLCDMGGNVREWTSDCYCSNQAFAPGGSWNEGSEQLKKFYAKQSFVLLGDNRIGFRIAAPVSTSFQQSLSDAPSQPLLLASNDKQASQNIIGNSVALKLLLALIVAAIVIGLAMGFVYLLERSLVYLIRFAITFIISLFRQLFGTALTQYIFPRATVTFLANTSRRLILCLLFFSPLIYWIYKAIDAATA